MSNRAASFFKNNRAIVDGRGVPGIYVQSHHLGTVVQCNNVAKGAAGGMTNEGCVS